MSPCTENYKLYVIHRLNVVRFKLGLVWQSK